MSNRDKYWASEYEHLRRKYHKEVNHLKHLMAIANHDWCDYLTEKGLVQDYLKWKGEKHGGQKNDVQKDH